MCWYGWYKHGSGSQVIFSAVKRGFFTRCPQMHHVWLEKEEVEEEAHLWLKRFLYFPETQKFIHQDGDVDSEPASTRRFQFREL